MILTSSDEAQWIAAIAAQNAEPVVSAQQEGNDMTNLEAMRDALEKLIAAAMAFEEDISAERHDALRRACADARQVLALCGMAP